MSRTAYTEPQCLYKGDLYLYIFYRNPTAYAKHKMYFNKAAECLKHARKSTNQPQEGGGRYDHNVVLPVQTQLFYSPPKTATIPNFKGKIFDS